MIFFFKEEKSDLLSKPRCIMVTGGITVKNMNAGALGERLNRENNQK
jgi:hypothetical protein